MAFKHYPVYTLVAGAQRLSAILKAVAGVDQSTPTSPGIAGVVGGADDVGFRQIFLQADGANANPIFVGGDSGVDSNNHAFRLEKGAAGVPSLAATIGPFEGGGVKPSDFWISGTAGEKIHVGGVPA